MTGYPYIMTNTEHAFHLTTTDAGTLHTVGTRVTCLCGWTAWQVRAHSEPTTDASRRRAEAAGARHLTEQHAA